MLYDSTKALLRNILRTLETPGTTAWDDQVESSQACLFEMHQMSRGLGRAYKTDKVKPGAQSQETEKVLRAMPHVRSMAMAIRLRDQAKAIEASKAALAEM
jgi:hypothetical protein